MRLVVSGKKIITQDEIDLIIRLITESPPNVKFFCGGWHGI
jgi:hypothetical protein